MSAASQALAAWEPLAAAALLHALRLVPLAMTSPVLGGPLVPPPVRVGLGLGLGAAAAALTGRTAPVHGLALAFGREALLGLLLAVVAAVPLEAARAAGRLADTFRGATLSELHVAPLRQRESACGDLLAQWVVVLAAQSGAGRLVLSGLLGSFVTLPAGAPFSAAAAREGALAAGAALLAAAVAVSAPAAVGVLAADLALAGVARVAPQLGVVNAAQPLRAALGLLAVAGAAAAAAGRLVALVSLPLQLLPGGAGGGP